MLLILPHINGVNSVRQIALLADADYKLVRKAISHLLYYNCIILLDIFSFAAIYAPTAELTEFVANLDMQDECARYVAIPDHNGGGSNSHSCTLSTTHLVELYCALKPGQSVKSFCIEHSAAVEGIDMRRFITFGIIKGFLYRIHKYAIATKTPHRAGKSKAQHHHTQWKRKKSTNLESSHSSDSDDNDHEEDEEKEEEEEEEESENTKTNATLAKYLDGTHCFDEICTELLMSEKELMARLNGMGADVLIIHR